MSECHKLRVYYNRVYTDNDKKVETTNITAYIEGLCRDFIGVV